MESDSEADPETFSDVDDDEVADYIHTDEEVKLRRVIWSELNKDYLETQAAKEAAVAAAPPGGAGAASAGDKGDETDEKDANGKGKKKRKRYTHVVPADTAAEAAHAMLSSKKISSKINYDALNNLFKDDAHHAHATRRGEEQTAKAPHPRGRRPPPPPPPPPPQPGGGASDAAKVGSARGSPPATDSAPRSRNETRAPERGPPPRTRRRRRTRRGAPEERRGEGGGGGGEGARAEAWDERGDARGGGDAIHGGRSRKARGAKGADWLS